MFKIIGEVNDLITNYNTGSLEIMNGLYFSQSQMIRTIEFYSSSKYLLGQLDELGKEKPFYNIVNGICDVENAAVALNTADLQVTADEPEDFDKSFLITKELHNWMKEVSFERTLNELRDTRTRYGGVLAKKCMDTDEDENKKILTIEVPEWKNLITDVLNIEDGVIIEKHYMSPAELARKKGIWDDVPEAIKLATKMRYDRNLPNQIGTSKRVPIFEVRGEFPKMYFKEAEGSATTDDDLYDYSYQLYIIAGEQNGKQILLYKEDNTERVYKYLARKKKAGRALGIGVVEEGEQSQIWTNDAMQKWQRAFEYSSKVIGQSASRKLKGRNMLTEVDNGTILEHDDAKPITAVPLTPAGGFAQFELLTQQWFSQYEKASSAYAMQRGEVTTKNFRLQSMALGQSGLVFGDLQTEMGVFVTEIFYDWILPYLSSQLNKAHILAYEFSPDELKTIDKSYSIHTANQQVMDRILSPAFTLQDTPVITGDDYDKAQQEALQAIQQTKTHRFMDIPKNYYKDLEPKLTFRTSADQKNKAAMLESLTNIMTIVAHNPAVLQDPVLSQVFMRIVELSGAGISPISLMAGIQEQAKIQKDAQKNASGKVSESISFKDLPPDGQVQMAQQAGIKIAQGTPQPVQGQGNVPMPQPKQMSLQATGGR